MDDKEILDMIEELDVISKELSRTQEEISREIVDKLSSIQNLVDNLPGADEDLPKPTPVEEIMKEPPKEVVIEESKIVIRQNGKVIHEQLY